MVYVSFLYPNFLYFLLLVPFFVFIYFFSLGYNKKKSFVFSNFHAIERFYGIELFGKNFFALYFNLIILILCVLSMSGMHLNFVASTSDHSYVLLIDNSRSMTATDINPNRLHAAKESATMFVDSLPLGVNVGVIGFSGEAVVYQEIVTDKIKIKMALNNINLGEVGGTNIYNAIISADRLFNKETSGKYRSIIILSDGQVNVGEAPLILNFVERKNIKLNTIAIGTEKGGETADNFISEADINFLKSLAFNTNGVFSTAEDKIQLDNSFNELINKVDDLIQVDISFYLLIAAIIILTLNWVLFNFRFRIYP
jgi:Ca-activated chloride channel homolog